MTLHRPTLEELRARATHAVRQAQALVRMRFHIRYGCFWKCSACGEHLGLRTDEHDEAAPPRCACGGFPSEAGYSWWTG